ncbi:hypothetical protein CVT25_006916 [Psilocybe cyanescens]|uniref:Uncharacterized protein n=1 Tax=Psilocybe cyanescens TaxID=93625 RepID=A0A409X5X2_PSICY|nr:hypothetical protein CVT25_006916 [Psilocybe cyanescens]
MAFVEGEDVCDMNSNVSGACGEIVALNLKGLYGRKLINPIALTSLVSTRPLPPPPLDIPFPHHTNPSLPSLPPHLIVPEKSSPQKKTNSESVFGYTTVLPGAFGGILLHHAAEWLPG